MIPLILANWRVFIIAGVGFLLFVAGFELRAVFCEAEQKVQLNKQLEETNKRQKRYAEQSENAEMIIARINHESVILNENIKDIYVQGAYRCVIPDDGLHLLAKAFAY